MESFDTFRDNFLSLYQSVVTDIARQIDSKPGLPARTDLQASASSVLPEIAADIAAAEFARARGLPLPPKGPTPRELTKGDVARVCADWALRYLKARVRNDAAAISRLNDEFKAGTCDPAWASTIDEYLRYFGPNGDRGQVPYIRAAQVGPKTIEIAAGSKIAIMGDWGTGGQPAIQLLRHIDTEKPDVVIHLGDIYYSGTPLECENNFAEPVRRVLRSNGRNPRVYTVSGNHDMYCGGLGFYDLITKLNPAPHTQLASFFSLRTSDARWQFLGMDTGLHDYSPLHVADAVTFLEEDEVAWHLDRIEEFSGRTILLSHHQLFSAFSAIGTPVDGKRSPLNSKLLAAFERLSRSGKIAAWFWGHEHTLSIYKPFAGLERGRCIGHGAVPTSIIDKIYDPLPDLETCPEIVDDTQLAKVGGVYAHGYAILHLQADHCVASYYQDDGGRRALVFEEAFK